MFFFYELFPEGYQNAIKGYKGQLFDHVIQHNFIILQAFSKNVNIVTTAVCVSPTVVLGYFYKTFVRDSQLC